MDISALVNQLSGVLDDQTYKASDVLAKIGSEEVVLEMIKLLEHPQDDSKVMAARTLGAIENNQSALDALLQAIDNNPAIAGELLVELEGFDLSAKYVPIFKYSLFGNFKVATVAQDLLDHKEFDITPRVIKKATKAWHHYENNVKHDEVFELKKVEVEEMLADLQAFVDSE
ncbi:HEAT repeats [Reichenbachiella faecimaris]|uniref:HEAT repeats n=1 Tax=Reichenbachiella faecimaris TaxID=692418 RepID=A0A1W2G5A6_REIFA|nr:HEAT repeat domain-containing protein [Reichenbachiella faecimaris]SMD31771.1 HEAT repeats [Reichenbachiella faecimaris]